MTGLNRLHLRLGASIAILALAQTALAAETLIVPAADGAYPLGTEVGWRFEQRAAVPTRVQRTDSRDALQRFCAGTSKMVMVSRPMLRDELASCAAKGVRFVEVPFSLDAVVLITGRGVKLASGFTRAKLAALWAQTPSGPRERWSQIDASWPNTKLRVVGPPRGASTLDYLERSVLGGPMRSDYLVVADPDQIVMNVAFRNDSLGLVDYSYFDESRAKLQALGIVAGERDQAIAPGVASVMEGTYPLIKPLLLYVERKALSEPKFSQFASQTLELAALLYRNLKHHDVHYIPLPEAGYARARERLQARTEGSSFKGELVQGKQLIDLLTQR